MIRDHVHVVEVVVVVVRDHIDVVVVIRDDIDVVVGHRGGDEVNVMSHRDGGCGNRWWARVEGRKRHSGGGLLAAEEAEAAKRREGEQEKERDQTKETKEAEETLLRGVAVGEWGGGQCEGVRQKRGGEKEESSGTHC